MAHSGHADQAATVVIRARLRGSTASAQHIHDQVTGATRELALAAGDISHHTYLNPQDPMEFLGIDVWRSAQASLAFAANPQIAEFFGRLFDGPPEVTVWVNSGWNEW